MARPLRFQYAGASYHLMARGDGGKAVFEEDKDRFDFLDRLGKVCGSHGWRIHAWVLMGNHFHLLVETPEPNLVTGMKTLLGGFSQAWNRRRKRMGHVFQGRYKSVPVSGEECDAWYFRIVADYIHLNPARAGLAGGNRRPLAGYRWSSVSSYAGGKTPHWLVHDRVLRAFELARDGRGRRAYVAWLEARAAEGGKITPEATKALKQGWHLGPESFRDRLLGLLDSAKKIRLKGSQAGGPLREHGAAEAERLLRVALPALELPASTEELAKLRKADPRKAAIAILLRKRTAVATGWIAERLAMGHASTVSRVAKDESAYSPTLRKLERAVRAAGDA
jgi:REP element-mobilizing transposase RayT